MAPAIATAADLGLSRGRMIAGKYRLESIVAAGGMGIVAVATHVQLRELVAIKFLRPGRASRRESVVRFLREAQAARRLRGQHVVRVFDVGTLEDDSPFIVMEYLAGTDLSALIAKGARLGLSTCVDYVLHACEALAEAHALGIVHRDLKPANLFLTQQIDGSPCIKVLDFGVSKIGGGCAAPADDPTGSDGFGGGWSDVTLDPPTSAPDGPRSSPHGPSTSDYPISVTRTRAQLGSPRYMSPEQIRSPRDVDARADVWALGAILYELLAGAPAFDESNPDLLRRAILERTPVSLRSLRADVPRKLEHVVTTCLAKEPSARCSDVAELARALSPFASADGRARCQRICSISERAGRVVVKDEATRPPRLVGGARRRAAWSAAALVLGMVGGVAALVSAFHTRGPAPFQPSTTPTTTSSSSSSAATAPTLEPETIAAAQAAASPSTVLAPRAPAIARGVRANLNELRVPSGSKPPRPISSGSTPALLPPAAPNADELDAGTLFDERK